MEAAVIRAAFLVAHAKSAPIFLAEVGTKPGGGLLGLEPGNCEFFLSRSINPGGRCAVALRLCLELSRARPPREASYFLFELPLLLLWLWSF